MRTGVFALLDLIDLISWCTFFFRSTLRDCSPFPMTALNPINCEWKEDGSIVYTGGIFSVPMVLPRCHENEIFFTLNLRGEYYVNETGWVIVCLNGFLGTLADHFHRFMFIC